MRLERAARRFDKTLASDAYNPATTFYCQLAPVDLYKIDGTAIRTRSMSCDAAIPRPARSVLQIGPDRYLVGNDSPDQWNGNNIRRNYVLQGADYTATLNSVGNVLTNVAGTTAYVSLDFNKNMTDERQDSLYHSQYNIFLGGSETVPSGSLINIGSKWYHIRQSYVSVSGLLVTLANEIEGTIFETVNFNVSTYNPVTDARTGAATSVKILRIRWTEEFKYLSQGTTLFERGDMVVMLPKTVTPKAADTLTLSDGTWRVISAQDQTTYWSCHVRR